jgi:hypothetical protein
MNGRKKARIEAGLKGRSKTKRLMEEGERPAVTLALDDVWQVSGTIRRKTP